MITYNEVNHINAVIENLRFADEIIVVDSFSTDGTLEKLEKMESVKVIQHTFKNFAEQRNFAIKQASGNWLFFMDADERLTSKSQEEILNVTQSNTEIKAFKIKRNFMFNNKKMRFSGLQTDQVLRLFKKEVAKYREDKLVHELLDYNGKYGILKHKMLHYSFSDYKSYKKKTEHYGRLKAEELYKNGKRPNWFHFYMKPAYKFVSNYILRLGFLDGKEGYTICYLNGYGVYYRYQVLKSLFTIPPK